MNSHISRTSTFSAPVVQSRLEHHHQQQMLNQTEARNQFHQRSKSLNNKGKRGFSYSQKAKENSSISFTTSSSDYSRNSHKNFSNYNNFDSSYYREHGYSNNNANNNFLVDNGSVGQLQRKTSTSNRPTRRHQHSDSIDEDKLRIVPTISILKRPQSATDFVKSSNSKSISPLDVTKEEQVINHQRPNSWERSSKQRSQSKERRRSDVTPSRSKYAQRKEIKSMEFETDLMLNQQLSGSSDESDVNSNKYVKSVSSSHINNTTTPQSSNAFIFPPLNYSNAIIALEEGMNSNNKREDIYSNSDDNITFKNSLANKKRSDQSTPRRLSSTAIELQSQVSRFVSDSDSDSSTRRPPSSSPGRLGVAPKLYAGPTFHNSPAPSDLPMPSFYGKSSGKESSPLSSNLFTVPENTSSVHPSYDNYSSPSSGNTSDDEIFSMDELEPPKVPYYSGSSTLRKQKPQELLRILPATNTRQQQTAAAYMVPERMATAHNPMHVYPSNDLNELSENLRSLLKIPGQ